KSTKILPSPDASARTSALAGNPWLLAVQVPPLSGEMKTPLPEVPANTWLPLVASAVIFRFVNPVLNGVQTTQHGDGGASRRNTPRPSAPANTNFRLVATEKTRLLISRLSTAVAVSSQTCPSVGER